MPPIIIQIAEIAILRVDVKLLVIKIENSSFFFISI